MNHENDLRVLNLIENAGVMMPPLVMSAYILPRVYMYANLFVLILFGLAAVIRRLPLKKYTSLVYPIAIIIVSISVIIWFLAASGQINHRYSVLGTPVNEPFFVSITISIGLVTLIEGIFARKLYSIITLMAFSTLTFLDLIAAFLVFRDTNYPFFTSYIYVEAMEYEALYTLVVYGYEFSLPLATFPVPIDPEILGSFIISLISIIIVSYRNGNKSIDRTSSFAYSIFFGSVLGLASFYFIMAMERFSLQFLAISIVIVVIFYSVIKTNPENARKHSNRN